MSAPVAGEATKLSTGVPAGETLLSVRDLKKYFPIRKGLFAKTVGHV